MKRTIALVAVAGLGLSVAAEEVSRRSFHFPVAPEVPIRISVDAATLRLEPNDLPEVETELVVRCTGDMGACEAAAREVAVGSFEDGDQADLRAEGPRLWGRGPAGERTRGFEAEGRRSSVRTCSSRCLKSSSRSVRRWEAPLLRADRWQLSLDLGVRYPVGRRLEVETKVGDLELFDLSSDVHLRLDRGTATISLPASRVGGVRLASRQGCVRLLGSMQRPLEGRSRARFESYLEHVGTGPVEIDVEVARGNVTVSLQGAPAP